MTRVGGIRRGTFTEAFEAERAELAAMRAEAQRAEAKAAIEDFARPRNRSERRMKAAVLRAKERSKT